MVFSATCGAISGSMGAILWSLNGTIRVMGWFQCHMRGYKVFRLSASRGAIQWSLSGTRRICGGLQCQKTLGMLFNGL